MKRPAYAYSIRREEIERLGPAALRAFERIAEHLNLSKQERLSLLDRNEANDVLEVTALTTEQFYRLSYIVGIWLDLGTLLGSADKIARWLRAPIYDEEYEGRSAIDYLITQGLPGFDRVRRTAAYWAANGW